MTPETLEIELTNHTTSPTVYATITGLAIDHSNAWFLLQSDGKTPYFPCSPSKILQPVSENCAIPLGEPGKSITVTIPRIAGGRIYLSIDKPLVFLLNPGPALVEPSVTNPTDKNYDTNWGFMEFTYNSDQLYANISYVDFVAFPIALTLVTSTGEEKKVLGLPKDGLQTIAQGLGEQSGKDGQGWKDLVVSGKEGKLLRILSPNQGIVLNRSLFNGYFESYIDEVWNHFSSQELKIDTQCAFGMVTGTACTSTSTFTFNSSQKSESFRKPTTADILNASSGSFQTGPSPLRNAIIPRLNAAFNRTVLLNCDCEIPARNRGAFYEREVTNHYARLVHEVNIDGKGYAHPYDDVAASGGEDHSGFVNDGAPKKLVVIVGGQ
ncbi:hypothetical protein EYR41_002581 [Orbilia oligospora]|uniref:GH64 domain-containing protein n=1 Tax=Orbilia oligospora TaxID=2813651 RepID=A0A8H2HVM3_ORBOL|nr:hypothetical protein EYR41_002581 [Orbilia oligospora]